MENLQEDIHNFLLDKLGEKHLVFMVYKLVRQMEVADHKKHFIKCLNQIEKIKYQITKYPYAVSSTRVLGNEISKAHLRHQFHHPWYRLSFFDNNTGVLTYCFGTPHSEKWNPPLIYQSKR